MAIQQAKLDEAKDAYSVMFDKVDWYRDIITMFENYLDRQTTLAYANYDRVSKRRGEFDYETGLHRGMQNAYADARVVLRDLLRGELLDLELM